MDEKNKELFLRYEEAKRMAKDAETIINELKPQLVEILGKDEKVNTGTATIYWKKGKKRWQFSEALQSEMESIAEKQTIEQQTGVAIAIEGDPYIQCDTKK